MFRIKNLNLLSSLSAAFLSAAATRAFDGFNERMHFPAGRATRGLGDMKNLDWSTRVALWKNPERNAKRKAMKAAGGRRQYLIKQKAARRFAKEERLQGVSF